MGSDCSQTLLSKAYYCTWQHFRLGSFYFYLSVLTQNNFNHLIPKIKNFWQGLAFKKGPIVLPATALTTRPWLLVPINSKLLHVLHCFNRFCLNLSK